MREHIVDQAQAILLGDLTDEERNSRLEKLGLLDEEEEFLKEWMFEVIENMDKNLDELNAEVFLMEDELRAKREFLENEKNRTKQN